MGARAATGVLVGEARLGMPAASATSASSSATAETASRPTATARQEAQKQAEAQPILPLGVPGKWHLRFSDEFAGSTLDDSKWTPGWFGTGVTQPVNLKSPECNDSAQVQLRGDGALTLSLIEKKTFCGGAERPYVSGLVSSNGKFEFRFGVAEARIYLPGDANGLVYNWPAFWTNGQKWPYDGENDIMEGLGGTVGPHFHSPRGHPGFTVPGSWSGWHTFAAEWAPGAVTYYYDGKVVGSIHTGITEAPMYLVLGYGATSNAKATPADMKIDYVRVWQR
ncbi:MAG TPA: glycoside hydrolase family 16 protein [Propionibacteriaceae bacterium]|nr:glycoside hydrolase family 16 protein [Propionibacteriaceae bacterium]